MIGHDGINAPSEPLRGLSLPLRPTPGRSIACTNGVMRVIDTVLLPEG